MSEDTVTTSLQAAPRRRGRPPGTGVKFPNLLADAKALGVSKTHLYFYLSGRRPMGKVLMNRWLTLKAEQEATSAQPKNPPQ